MLRNIHTIAVVIWISEVRLGQRLNILSLLGQCLFWGNRELNQVLAVFNPVFDLHLGI